jgi:predicted transposase YbfD/YdcC
LSKKTLQIIKETGNNAVVQVKDNQESFLKEIKQVAVLTQPVSTFKEKPEKNRNRIEYREARVFKYPVYLRITSPLWHYTVCFTEVKRETHIFNTKKKCWEVSIDTSYYIATYLDKAKNFSTLIRNHWLIENANNYVKDVSLNEDSSRIRKNATVVTTFRSLALNILRFNNSSNIRDSLVRNVLNFNKILNLKGIL